MDIATFSLGDAAVEYARRGWRVLPVTPRGKLPILQDWPNKASNDVDTVTAWWADNSEANIGIACGELIVIDVDGEIGEDSLACLQIDNEILPPTLEARTGTGRHLYFTCDEVLGNTASNLAEHLDSRGKGGMVVASPSVHPNGAVYAWINDLEPAPLPAWVVEKLRQPPPTVFTGENFTLQNARVTNDDRTRVRGYLDQWGNQVRSTAQGSRNKTLNDKACRAGNFIASDYLEATEVFDALMKAGLDSGLTEKECRTTIDSGMKRGLREPRYLPNANPDPPKIRLAKVGRGQFSYKRASEYLHDPDVETFWDGRLARGYVTVLAGNGGIGKALDLTTPIPTPSGWSEMGNLKVGDFVFDETGHPCRVTALGPIWTERPCYEVSFSDHTSIIADEQHEWATWNGFRRDGSPSGPTLRTTKEIARSLVSRTRVLKMEHASGKASPEYRHKIKVAAPLDLPERDLPIDPYVLGAWLGDGTAADHRLTCFDSDIISEIERRGYKVNDLKNEGDFSIICSPPFGTLTRDLGLRNNKHIPAAYLRGSISQRLDLFRGLMDTDGGPTSYAPGDHCTCEFTNTNRAIAFGTLELARSLGLRATIHEGRARLYGKDCGPKWRIFFANTPQIESPFVMKRKRDAVSQYKARMLSRKVIDCQPIESVPVRCIEVDSSSHLYLAGKSMIPTHNSTITGWLSAAITNGEDCALMGWKNSTISGEVLLISYEDSGKLIMKRNEVLGADNDKVIVMEGRKIVDADGNEMAAPITAEDIEFLEIEIRDQFPDLALLVIDPWKTLVVDINRPEIVNPVTHALQTLAARRNIAVLVVAHWNAAGRVAGYRGLHDTARSVMECRVLETRPDATRVALLHTKHNLTPEAAPLIYEFRKLEEVDGVKPGWFTLDNPFTWIEESKSSAEFLMRESEATGQSKAEVWLRQMLIGEDRPANEIEGLAIDDGIKTMTLRAAVRNVIREYSEDGVVMWGIA